MVYSSGERMEQGLTGRQQWWVNGDQQGHVCPANLALGDEHEVVS